MKTNKVVASSLFAAMFMLTNVSADTAVAEPEAPAAVEEETAVEEDAGSSCCCSPFGGLYFGLGLGWNIMKLKGELAAEADAKLPDGLQFASKYDNNSVSKNANRFVGTFMLGGGKLWDNGFYAGLNFYFDLGQKKKVAKNLKDATFTDGGIGTVTPRLRMRTGAWSPALALRLGFVPASYNTAMVYLDLGAAYNKAEYRFELLEQGKDNIKKKGDKELVGEWTSASKITPLVRLGVQKAIGSKFIAGLEVEYKFRASKSEGSLKAEKAEDKGRFKRKFAEGFTIRLVGTCNFKFN